MIRTFVIPAIIVAAFLSIAATLMATSPALEPASSAAGQGSPRQPLLRPQAVLSRLGQLGRLPLARVLRL